jgi:hypothetical protein
MISSPGCASLSKHIEGSLIGADRRDHTCNQMISIELKRDRVVEENAYCERCISVSAKKLQQQLRGAQCAE